MSTRVRLHHRDPKECLRLDEVAKLLGVRPRTVKEWVKLKRFPRPIKPTETLSLWLWGEVDAWIEERKARRDSACSVNVSSVAANPKPRRPVEADTHEQQTEACAIVARRSMLKGVTDDEIKKAREW